MSHGNPLMQGVGRGLTKCGSHQRARMRATEERAKRRCTMRTGARKAPVGDEHEGARDEHEITAR